MEEVQGLGRSYARLMWGDKFLLNYEKLEGYNFGYQWPYILGHSCGCKQTEDTKHVENNKVLCSAVYGLMLDDTLLWVAALLENGPLVENYLFHPKQAVCSLTV